MRELLVMNNMATIEAKPQVLIVRGEERR